MYGSNPLASELGVLFIKCTVDSFSCQPPLLPRFITPFHTHMASFGLNAARVTKHFCSRTTLQRAALTNFQRHRQPKRHASFYNVDVAGLTEEEAEVFSEF